MELIAHIFSHSDPSVGSYGFSVKAETGLDIDEFEKDEIEALRKDFEKCYGELWCEKAYCQFQHEIDEQEKMFQEME